MKKVLISTMALALVMSAGMLQTASAKTLRLGHIVPPSHIWHRVADRFADNLKKATDGDLKIKVFPLSKLGKEPQMTDLLQTGAIQLAVLTAGGLSNRSDSMNAWFLPYLFTDVADAAEAARSPVADKILQDLDKHGLVGLGYALAGMRHILSVDAVENVADLKNKKIRAFPNKVFNDWWSGVGAAPTALPLGDIAPALTTNLLDIVDVDLDIVVGMKFYQQAPNLTLSNHMAFPGVVVASNKWWNTLDTKTRGTIMTAFREAESWGFQQQIKAEVSNLEKLKKAGVKVHQMDKSLFKKEAKVINQKYTAENATIADFYNQSKK